MFEVLYDRYIGAVFNKCYSFASSYDEAKDLTQDVFLNLFVRLASFKGKSKFSTWLYSFTYNYCVNYVTRNTAKKIEKKSVSVDALYDLADTPTQVDFSNMKSEHLKQAMKELPPKDKMMLMLRYEDGLSIKEISEAQEMGESAVKMRLKRAKEKLVQLYHKTYTDGKSV